MSYRFTPVQESEETKQTVTGGSKMLGIVFIASFVLLCVALAIVIAPVIHGWIR